MSISVWQSDVLTHIYENYLCMLGRKQVPFWNKSQCQLCSHSTFKRVSYKKVWRERKKILDKFLFS